MATKDGDKFICDACSLSDFCKYYREGSVCSLPDSEASALARMFKTRDADTIVQGLGDVMSRNAERLEAGIEREDAEGELDPEVTKIVNSLMTHGIKMAKMIDPQRYAGGPKVGVFVNGAAAPVGGPVNMKQMVAAAYAELEAQGIPRSEIDPQMIMNLLASGPVTAGTNGHAAVVAGELG